MLGVVVALPWELKSLTRETMPAGTWKALTPEILVVSSGIGAERAYEAGSVLIAHGANALLSWGYAAALDDRLKAGCLLLPERVLGANGETYPVDAGWHRRLYRALESELPVCKDALVESAAVVKTPAEKRALWCRTCAAGTDMESAAHARAAEQHGLPFLAVRSILDTASTDIPEAVLQALDAEGNVDRAKLFIGACRAPADWIKMARLALKFRAAQRTLMKAKARVFDSSRF